MKRFTDLSAKGAIHWAEGLLKTKSKEGDVRILTSWQAESIRSAYRAFIDAEAELGLLFEKIDYAEADDSYEPSLEEEFEVELIMAEGYEAVNQARLKLLRRVGAYAPGQWMTGW